MVIYHYCYNVCQILNVRLLDNIFLSIMRDIFAGIFIMIAGFSCNFSRNNILRGIKCLSLALLITLVTFIFEPSQLIVFGVLHMLGLSMLFYGLCEKFFKRLSSNLLLILCFLSFITTFDISKGFIGLFNIKYVINDNLYNYKFLFPLGLVNRDFRSADYFAMIPWIFIFLFGAILGSLRNVNDLPEFMYKSRFKLLEIIGKKTLLIYILHQPIFYLLLNLYLLF